jgi:hypothetical protein
MKINTSILQALTVAVTLGVTASACAKKAENVEPQKVDNEQKTQPKTDTTTYCPACGMG